MSTPVRPCSVCAKHITVRKDGNTSQHLGDIWIAGKATTCKGSGQPPKREEGR
jgi:hypothetical protein